MDTIEFIKKQIKSTNVIIHELIDDMNDTEWATRAGPGLNPVGFTLWHIARQQDNTVQTLIRGVPEVITEARWRGRGGLTTSGTGIGFTREEVDQIPPSVVRGDYLEYDDAVCSAILKWLGGLQMDDLDTIPDTASHVAGHPEYERASFQKELEDLFDQPMWRYLAGPCIGHIRGHLGEVDILKQIVRSGQY